MRCFRDSIPTRGRAFTLIEMIVVIILLAIVSAAVLPRAFDTGAKRAEQTARGVASLLTAVAQRDATAFEPMLVAYSLEDEKIEVRVMREVGGQRQWTTDLFVDGVSLREVTLRSAQLDGYPLDDTAWTIEIPVSRPRPLIELVVGMSSWDKDSKAWRITLEPGASTARLSDARVSTPSTSGPDASSVDLDALGLGESAW